VEVNIADNGEGELDITVTSENAASLNFTNTYAAAGELDLTGMKTLTGRDLIDGEFEFELYEEPIMIQLLMEPSLVETVSNDENGIFSFTTLEFGIDDTNRPRAFRVIEKNTGLGGVNYDETVYLIYVFVTDNGDGTLDVEPFIMSEEMSDDEGSVDIVFNNTYAAAGELDLSGTKTLNGRALAAGEFEFDLYEGETLLETVSNLADGSYSFTSLSFTEADIDTTKTYTVVEKQGTLSNVTYDDTTYTLTVNISDNKDGTLAIDVTGADPVGLDFTNTFTPPTITVTTESIPLAKPTIIVTTESIPLAKPTIIVTTESIPLADPSTTPSTIVVAREEIPQSGESGPLWPIGLVLLALAGGLGFIVHRSDSRKAQKEKSKKL
jgi:pilin isopeptide linkage protein